MQRAVWTVVFLMSFNGIAMDADLLKRYDEFCAREAAIYRNEYAKTQQALRQAMRERRELAASIVSARKEKEEIERKLQKVLQEKKENEKQTHFKRCTDLIAQFKKVDRGFAGKDANVRHWGIVKKFRASMSYLSSKQLHDLRGTLGKTSPNGALLNAALIECLQKKENQEGVSRKNGPGKSPSPLGASK